MKVAESEPTVAVVVAATVLATAAVVVPVVPATAVAVVAPAAPGTADFAIAAVVLGIVVADNLVVDSPADLDIDFRTCMNPFNNSYHSFLVVESASKNIAAAGTRLHRSFIVLTAPGLFINANSTKIPALESFDRLPKP